VAFSQLKLADFFVRFLAIPLFIGVVRVYLAMRLVRCYCQMERADLVTALERIGSSHSSTWLCSAATLAIFAALLAMWHGFWFLLMVFYEGTPDEAAAVAILVGFSLICTLANGCLWWNCAKIIQDIPDKPDDVGVLRRLVDRVRRTRSIRFAQHKQLEAEAEIARVATEQRREVPGDEDLPVVLPPESCVVCLEEFSPDNLLAQLPCGHIFHPMCVHNWLREGDRCPFRCDVAPRRPPQSLRPQVQTRYVAEVVEP